MEGKSTSQDGRPGTRETNSRPTRVVNEFQIQQRGVALRMRIERWPAKREWLNDDVLTEAGYGHGV